jgi:hypothetical protein
VGGGEEEVLVEVEGGIGWGAINHFLMITKSRGLI